ncbi:hypothetical protein P2H44_20015 [Albimonas sp. CAU 1670]|uniref:hypothetical protein n=1 Tax=Albimonas sp. CAU 1670 TaxID=3032599 RepID=UPI0023DCBDA0|nr:hypothetical protein [Albimonas sp. CAU 1670]MDF2234853.1 hypothetical protein [Albimonas sp. CAU 1670]
MTGSARSFAPPSLDGRVRAVEALAADARGMAAGSSPSAAEGRLARSKAAAAMQEAEAALLALDALRERLLSAHDLAAEIVRQSEEKAA